MTDIKKFTPRSPRPEDRLRRYETSATDIQPWLDHRQRVKDHITASEQLREDVANLALSIIAAQNLADLKFAELKKGDPQHQETDEYRRMRREKIRLGMLHSKSMRIFTRSLEMEMAAAKMIGPDGRIAQEFVRPVSLPEPEPAPEPVDVYIELHKLLLRSDIRESLANDPLAVEAITDLIIAGMPEHILAAIERDNAQP